jgi:glutamine synthetase adenylyltransferase
VWRRSSFEVLKRLTNAGLLEEATSEELSGALFLFRRTLSRARLIAEHPVEEIDLAAGDTVQLAARMGHENVKAFADELLKTMEAVARTFDQFIGGTH